MSDFHTKYRPKTFEEVVGQDETVKALQTVLGDDKYRLLELAYKIFDSRSDTATESEMTEFEVLFARYQHEILRNYFPGI